jgi:AraC family transcriptional regulator
MSNPYADEKQLVRFSPASLIERQMSQWQGLRAEIVTAVERQPFDYTFNSTQHLLIAAEYSEREDGETLVEGLPKSTLHSLTGTLTLVPAGHAFHGWQNPRVLTRVNYFYIDPSGPLLDQDTHFAQTDFRPQLFFFDAELWRLAGKLKEQAKDGARLTHYGEALSVLLAHELIRFNDASLARQGRARGGLSGWQRTRVVDFIEAHLADDVRLSALAGLVDLSPYHFSRAFKQSFGVSPHRYHVGRRIERAKMLLAERSHSVTSIALAVGFAETSSFSTAFRKITGLSPSEYRRGGPR